MDTALPSPRSGELLLTGQGARLVRSEESSDEKVGPLSQLAVPDQVELELVQDHISPAISGPPTHGARKNPEDSI